MNAEPEVTLDDLAQIALRQEQAAIRNRTAAPGQWELIDFGLALGWTVTDLLHRPAALAGRRQLTGAAATRDAICANLLHAAWCSLASAGRLVSWGAIADGMTLIRSAFEHTAFAELFRRVPEEAAKWDSLGRIANLEERRRRLAKMYSGVWSRLDGLDAADRGTLPEAGPVKDSAAFDRTRRGFYRELSSFGPHPGPASVVMRLSTAEPGAGNLGFVSVGQPAAIEYATTRCLDVLVYCIGEFFDSYSQYLEAEPELFSRLEALKRRYSSFAATPRKPYFSPEYLVNDNT